MATLGLLRADLYRAFCPSAFGGLGWWLLALTVVLSGATAPLLTHGVWAAGAGPAAAGSAVGTASELWGQAFAAGGLCALGAGLCVAALIQGDLGGGFARSLMPSLRGRASYLAEKVLLAGVLAALFVGADAVAALLGAWASGAAVEAEPALASLAWLGLAWLSCWALGVAAALVALAVRRPTPCYLLTAILPLGTVPELLRALAHSSGGLIWALVEPVAPALAELAHWLPSAALTALAGGADVALGPAAGALAVPGGFATQAILSCAVAGVLMAALAALALKGRDLA